MANLSHDPISSRPISATLGPFNISQAFVSNANAPQLVDPFRAAGYAVVIAASIAGFSPRTMAFVGNSASPQLADLTQQAQITKPLVGFRPNPIPLTSNANEPQLADLTLQAVLSKPLIGFKPYLMPLIQGAPQQIDFTQQAVIARPLLGPQGPTVRPFYAAPELRDLTLQAVLSAPLLGPQGPTVRPLQGGPLPTDFTQQATITPPAPGLHGSTVRPFVAEAFQVDLTLPAQIQPTVRTPVAVTPQPVPPLIWAQPVYDLTQQGFVLAPLVASTAASGAEYQWGIHAQAIYEAYATRVIFPTANPPQGYIFLNPEVPPQIDLTPPSFVWSPLTGVLPVVTSTLDPWPVHWPMPPVSQAQLKKFIEAQRKAATRRARQIAAQVRNDQDLRETLEKALRGEEPIEKVVEVVQSRPPLPTRKVDWEQVKRIASKLLEKAPPPPPISLEALPDPEEAEIAELDELQSLYAQDFYERIEALRRLIRKKLN